MDRYSKLKTAIIILSLIIVFESILLIRFLPKRPRKAVPIVKGKIAIIIDDWGYNLNNLHFLDQIHYPLTISILPRLAYSREIAYEANNKGLEIILHLPLEPLPSEKRRLEQNTITTDMDQARIRDIFLQDLNSVMGARGVSNHMGSQATANLRVMEIIFGEMKKKNLYFLDSLVSKESICKSLSRKMDIGFGQRDIFLDNKDEPEYIKGQIYKLKLRAKRRGFAIGVGHDKRMTLEVLKEMLPQLEKEGYKFVFVSELVK